MSRPPTAARCAACSARPHISKQHNAKWQGTCRIMNGQRIRQSPEHVGSFTVLGSARQL